jgi:hypothetical protein
MVNESTHSRPPVSFHGISVLRRALATGSRRPGRIRTARVPRNVLPREAVADLVDREMEASIRRGATAISLALEKDFERDRFEVRLEDNAPLASVEEPLFVPSAEGRAIGEARGSVTVRPSALGGRVFQVSFPFSRLDRSPVGDLVASACALACTQAHVDVWVDFRVGDRSQGVGISTLARRIRLGTCRSLTVCVEVLERFRALCSEGALVAAVPDPALFRSEKRDPLEE